VVNQIGGYEKERQRNRTELGAVFSKSGALRNLGTRGEDRWEKRPESIQLGGSGQFGRVKEDKV